MDHVFHVGWFGLDDFVLRDSYLIWLRGLAQLLAKYLCACANLCFACSFVLMC